MRWFSAGDMVTLAKAFPAGISGVELLDLAGLYMVGVPEDVLEAHRRRAAEAEPSESAPPVVSAPIEAGRKPTKR